MVTVKDQFKKFSKYNPIISTTYNFDLATIKEIISPRQGIRDRSIIITDRECFFKKIDNSSFYNQGLSYFIYPAYDIKGAFHPKVTIGIEDGCLKLLIGSHNLTRNGVKSNLEITSFYEIPLLENYKSIIQGISTFILGIINNIKSDNTIKKEITNISDCLQDLTPIQMKIKTESLFYFIHTYKKSILEQIIELTPEIKHVFVCVPTLSTESDFIEESIDLLGSKATFFIDPMQLSIGDKVKKVYEKYNVRILNIAGTRRLHAKLYIFHSKEGDWVLYGSPNFTRMALMKSVNDGGNLEAAILVPPTKPWNWKQLFQDTVSSNPIQWSELQSTEDQEIQTTELQYPIEKWGYETPNNEGVILAPGFPEGKIVYIHLFNIDKKIEVKVSGGLIRFKIPLNWNNDTRYEIYDETGNMLVSGFLNRSGAPMRELSNIDINDASKLRLWFFLHRLRNFQPHKYDRYSKNEIPDIIMDPTIWEPGKITGNWKPISKKIMITEPKKIFKESLSKFDKTCNKFYEEESNILSSLKIRELLIAMDIFLEGTFYASVLHEGRKEYLVYLARKLGKFLKVPCDDNPMLLWNEKNWHKKYYGNLNKDILELWSKFGNRLCLDVSILFNFWVYINKFAGYDAFNKGYFDVYMMTNKYYQILMVLKKLIKGSKIDSSFQRIWDNRISFLEKEVKIKIPSNINELEGCIEYCYKQTSEALNRSAHTRVYP